MASGKTHLIVSICATLLLWIVVGLLPWIGFDATLPQIPAIIFSFFAGWIWCDLDQYVDWLEHRSVWTHNTIPAIIFALVWNFINSGVEVGLFCFLVGLHCLVDAWKDPKKQVGYWLIAYTKKHRMDKTQSYGWLALNAGFGIGTGLLVMLF